MIINHSLGFVFIHVPKAAGTSISRLFTSFSTYRDQEIGGTPMGEILQPFFKRRYGLAKHSTAAEVMQVMGEQRFTKYFTFAFVRNPYTRAFSTYNYLRRQRDHKDLRLVQAVSHLETFGDYLRSEYAQGEGMDRLLCPQVMWTELAPGAKLSFVGSVEAIEADVAHTLKRVAKPGKKNGKIPEGKGIQSRNRSTEDPDQLWRLLREDPQSEQLIYERYRADFEAYGYERFDLAADTAYDERRLQDRGTPRPAPLAASSADAAPPADDDEDAGAAEAAEGRPVPGRGAAGKAGRQGPGAGGPGRAAGGGGAGGGGGGGRKGAAHKAKAKAKSGD
jgi:Sulfotransferase family